MTEPLPEQFVSAEHAYHAGLLLGLLMRNDVDVAVSPGVDTDGNWLNRIHLAVAEDEYTFTIAVLPPGEDAGQSP